MVFDCKAGQPIYCLGDENKPTEPQISDMSQLEIEEFDEIGRDEFLKKYEFGKAKTSWLIYKGQRYDSKAIIGAAYCFATNRRLKPKDFYGGDPVLKELRDRGFECKKDF